MIWTFFIFLFSIFHNLDRSASVSYHPPVTRITSPLPLHVFIHSTGRITHYRMLDIYLTGETVMKPTFSILAFVLPLAACTTDAKLMPVNMEVAADIPAVAALGWLQKMPRDMNGSVTPAYPQACRYTAEGVITTEWVSDSLLAPPKPGKARPIRPWQDFQALPAGTGLQTYYEYSVSINYAGEPHESCNGRVGLRDKEGGETCAAYYNIMLVNNTLRVMPRDCATVKREVERTLTALKALGVDVVPQKR